MNDSLEKFWAEFYNCKNEIEKHSFTPIFRGVPQESHELIPSIGRKIKKHTNDDITAIEEDILNEFKRLSIILLEKQPVSDFEWLFLAQHYGLPTRLLDWSTNPMVALFFAVEKNDDSDGVLYLINYQFSDHYGMLDFRTADVSEENKKKYPWLAKIRTMPDQGNVIFVRPKYTDQRYLNQKSILSCHRDPFSPISLSNVKQSKLIIKKELKPKILKQLRQMGFSHSYIYPGLEGVAREIKEDMFVPVEKGLRGLTTRFTVSIPWPPKPRS